MKNLRSNSKEVRNAIDAHILQSVTDNEGNEYNDVKRAAIRLYSEFDRVANYPYNLQKFPNEQERFSDYLNGIPFGFEYAYYEIIEFLNSIGLNNEGKEYDDEKAMNLYHYLIFAQTTKHAKNKTV